MKLPSGYDGAVYLIKIATEVLVFIKDYRASDGAKVSDLSMR